MRPITWLHLSDMHLRPGEAWAQDVVLNALCDDIVDRRITSPFDFVLLSGDLAYSGKPEEYEIAAAFLDNLSSASNVPKAHIYCVPGNHDINRKRQNMTFTGARRTLTDPNHTDAFLAPASRHDLATLLQREEGYRAFQESYFTDQKRIASEDSLAYVAHLAIENIQLVIVGLDSAWLAEGGPSDHGKVLIGERQVINALKLVKNGDDIPHVVLAMSHHPLQWLNDFDRRPIQAQIERTCHFLHCGHLHDPEQRPAWHGDDSHGCLTLAAGALFETRHTHNSYTVVTIDPLRAICSVTTVQYNPGNVAFVAKPPAEFPFEIQPKDICSIGELAAAIAASEPESALWPHYRASLLLDQKSEIPVPTAVGFALGSFAVLEAGPNTSYKTRTATFKAFRNVLRVLYSRVPLAQIFELHGQAVADYGAALAELSQTVDGLRQRLDALEVDARNLSGIEASWIFSHTVQMLNDLATKGYWNLLRDQATRHLESPSQRTAKVARRMLALALSNSSERADKQTAVSHYQQLHEHGNLAAEDFGNLALLLVDVGDPIEGQAVILRGIAACESRFIDQMASIGHRIVETTGDREFREKLNVAIAERNAP